MNKIFLLDIQGYKFCKTPIYVKHLSQYMWVTSWHKNTLYVRWKFLIMNHLLLLCIIFTMWRVPKNYMHCNQKHNICEMKIYNLIMNHLMLLCIVFSIIFSNNLLPKYCFVEDPKMTTLRIKWRTCTTLYNTLFWPSTKKIISWNSWIWST